MLRDVIHRAHALYASGQYWSAVDIIEEAIAKDGDPALRLYRAQMYPKVPVSVSEIAKTRETASEHLRVLAHAEGVISDPLRSVNKTGFHTVYHHHNALPMQRALAEAHAKAIPGLVMAGPRLTRGRHGKRRIGVLSSFLGDHVVGRSVANLSAAKPECIDLALIQPDGVAGPEGALRLPLHLGKAREVVAALELDLLLYPEIGMDPFCYYLAFSRLAPVQAVMPGQGMTTGISAVDYFLTAKVWEREGEIQSDYSETPVQLDEMPYFFGPDTKPADPSILDHFPAIPRNRPYFLCLHTIYKYHPDFDQLLRRVLSADPDPIVVILHSPGDPWWGVLWRRWEEVLGSMARRVHAVPRVSRTMFLGLLQGAAAVLDTPHHCSGTTAFEALHAGVPVITKPSAFMRTRMTAGLYTTLGMDWAIAASDEQYIETAVKLATDVRQRAIWRANLLESRNRIVASASTKRAFFDALLALMMSPD